MNVVYFLKLDTQKSLDSPAQRELCSKTAKKIVERFACENYGVSPQELVFEKSEKGKPYIKNLPDFHFNISHSENAVAVAVSDCEVGIDCEKIRSADMRIAKRRFTKNEYDYICEDSPQTDRRFFEIWTKKEAFLKLSGKGITLPLDSFDVCDGTLNEKFSTTEMDGFLISVCTDSPTPDFIFKENFE